jgi:hypothetical protein
MKLGITGVGAMGTATAMAYCGMCTTLKDRVNNYPLALQQQGPCHFKT